MHDPMTNVRGVGGGASRRGRESLRPHLVGFGARNRTTEDGGREEVCVGCVGGGGEDGTPPPFVILDPHPLRICGTDN
jgi:hypothetical protein